LDNNIKIVDAEKISGSQERIVSVT